MERDEHFSGLKGRGITAQGRGVYAAALGCYVSTFQPEFGTTPDLKMYKLQTPGGRPYGRSPGATKGLTRIFYILEFVHFPA